MPLIYHETFTDPSTHLSAGTFTKIAEPEPTKDQVQRMKPLARAGRQKNKIDKWVVSSGTTASANAGDQLETNGHSHADVSREDGARNKAILDNTTTESVACPVCDTMVSLEDINEHLDSKHWAPG